MQPWGYAAVAVKPGSWCQLLPGAQIKELGSVCEYLCLFLIWGLAHSFTHTLSLNCHEAQNLT